MFVTRKIALLVSLTALSACAGTEPATRAAFNAPSDVSIGSKGSDVIPATRYNITGFDIVVPQKLRVSEANVFYPIADIVWRGEPRGERHAQVAAILQDALGRATTGLTTGRAVRAEIELLRFHALTEKTRYTFGGVHSLWFKVTLRDALTGALVEQPFRVIADTPASGGARAIAEDEAGLTQRVVIVNRVAKVFEDELAGPRKRHTLKVAPPTSEDARIVAAN